MGRWMAHQIRPGRPGVLSSRDRRSIGMCGRRRIQCMTIFRLTRHFVRFRFFRSRVVLLKVYQSALLPFRRIAFGSEAANLEYAMLSSMFADSGTVTTPTLQSNSTDPPLFTMDNDWPESGPLGQPSLLTLRTSSSSALDTTMDQPGQPHLTITQPFTMSGSAARYAGHSAPPGEEEGIAGLTFSGSAGGVVVGSPATTMTPRDVYSLVVKPQ